ncbi:hypothetical protein GQX73_g3328 [Xylaria multiplex]|uniref:NADP-dependent oxidoreductase domain-containing protein n=1 Tax=Xylaria multiplex TaxID=323545 RepID=A0A7C8IU49_9PEZI|nr:hypothetical protein GQX73_g3328 [Xylaria multiplex]
MDEIPPPSLHLERTTIGGNTSIPRIISGLWQLAGGHDEQVNIDEAAGTMELLVKAGFDCFDMADHYGVAELVVGKFRASSPNDMLAFTKWCPPENGIKSFEAAEQAVMLSGERMKQRQITLMQCRFLPPHIHSGNDASVLSFDHIWNYADDTYWHNLMHLRVMQKRGNIKHIGVTNVDAAHLELLIDSGFDIATNQVSCSVLDQRLVRGRLASVCVKHKVGVLAYGTLLGGFLSEKWLDQPEPEDMNSLNWSLRKYLRFIRAAGGWEPFQGLLRALSAIAQKHNVSIPAVATRYVLDIPIVSAVIVGCRLSAESYKYATRNLEAFSFALSEDDYVLIRKAQQALSDIPGDCGDEYRRPPYLTAAGDLSHHLKDSQDKAAERSYNRREEDRVLYGESMGADCRLLPADVSIPVLGGSSARSQTVAILDIIAHAIKALGGTLSDVVRTRVIVRNEQDCEEISRLVGAEYLVEIEAEACLGFNEVFRLSLP